MWDTAKGEDICVPGIDCGNRTLSLLFFISFIIIMQYIMLNLFILILVQEMEINYLNKNNALHDFKLYESAFQEIWSLYCLRNDRFKVQASKLTELYIYLEKPLGFGAEEQIASIEEIEGYQMTQDELLDRERELKKELKQQAAKMIMYMGLKIDEDGYAYYNEVFFLFFKEMMKSDLNKESTPQGIDIIRKAEIQTMKKLKRQREKIRFRDKEENQSQLTYNPLITILFTRMVFNSWRKYTRIFESKRTAKLQNDLQQQFLIEMGQISSKSSVDEESQQYDPSIPKSKSHNTSEYDSEDEIQQQQQMQILTKRSLEEKEGDFFQNKSMINQGTPSNLQVIQNQIPMNHFELPQSHKNLDYSQNLYNIPPSHIEMNQFQMQQISPRTSVSRFKEISVKKGSL